MMSLGPLDTASMPDTAPYDEPQEQAPSSAQGGAHGPVTPRGIEMPAHATLVDRGTASRSTPDIPWPARRRRHDPWFAEDKAKHFTMSFAATGFAFGAARSVGLGHDAALITAGAAAVAAGIGKELYDRRTGGFFSMRDMTWNVIGVAAGIALAAQTR